MFSYHWMTKNATLVTIGVFTIVLIVSFWVLPGHMYISVSLALASVLAAMWWFYHFDLLRRTQTPSEDQLFAKVHNSRVSPGAVDRIRHHLLPGEDIHDIRHRSVFYLLRRVWLEALLLVIMLVMSGLIGSGTVPSITAGSHNRTTAVKTGGHSAQTNPAKPGAPVVKPPLPGVGRVPIPKKLTIDWWIPLLVAIVPAYLIYRKWLYWASWFIIYTKDRILVVVEPFSIFPFYKPMMDDEIGISRYFRIKIEVKGDTYAKRWGKSIFSIATMLSEKEEPARDIVGLPDPDSLKALIDNDIRNRDLAVDKQQREQSAAMIEKLDEVVQSNREVASAIKARWPYRGTNPNDMPTEEL